MELNLNIEILATSDINMKTTLAFIWYQDKYKLTKHTILLLDEISLKDWELNILNIQNFASFVCYKS